MSTRDRTIIGVICLVAAVLAPWLLVVSPKRTQADKLQAQISATQSQLSSIQAQVAQGEQARSRFASSYEPFSTVRDRIRNGTYPGPQPSPHSASASLGVNTPAFDTAWANFSISGASLCSGMFGMRS